MIRIQTLLFAFILLMLAPLSGHAADTAPGDASRIYGTARQALVQVRTLLKSADRQTAVGSGFVVDASGLVVTNYHVVSEFALEPATYKLQYLTTSGQRGELKLLAIDVPNDLAVVQLDRRDLPVLQFDDAAVHEQLAQGQKLYSLGNPLDIGFTIVEGIYNGHVERSYQQRIHFTGAINAGMSGGPALTPAGKVAGINVARARDGELVSFLVPARPAAELVQRALHEPPLDTAMTRKVISQQVGQRQHALVEALLDKGFVVVDSGPYRAPEGPQDWFTCWAETNATDQPTPLAIMHNTQCDSDTSLFISESLETGAISIEHRLVTTDTLNAFQFSSALSGFYRAGPPMAWRGLSTRTPSRCHDDFVDAGNGVPPLRMSWCARAYRDFDDLYDVSVSAVTRDDNHRALIVRAEFHGVSFADGQRLGRRFIEALSLKS